MKNPKALVSKKRTTHSNRPIAGRDCRAQVSLDNADTVIEERYNKISYCAEALDALLVDLFLEAHPCAPREIVLDPKSLKS